MCPECVVRGASWEVLVKLWPSGLRRNVMLVSFGEDVLFREAPAEPKAGVRSLKEGRVAGKCGEKMVQGEPGVVSGCCVGWGGSMDEVLKARMRQPLQSESFYSVPRSPLGLFSCIIQFNS